VAEGRGGAGGEGADVIQVESDGRGDIKGIRRIKERGTKGVGFWI
jgi:hypothetical protein